MTRYVALQPRLDGQLRVFAESDDESQREFEHELRELLALPGDMSLRQMRITVVPRSVAWQRYASAMKLWQQLADLGAVATFLP